MTPVAVRTVLRPTATWTVTLAQALSETPSEGGVHNSQNNEFEFIIFSPYQSNSPPISDTAGCMTRCQVCSHLVVFAAACRPLCVFSLSAFPSLVVFTSALNDTPALAAQA